MSLVEKLRVVSQLIENGPDVHSEYFTSAKVFSSEIEDLIEIIEQSETGLFLKVKALAARKKAKFTWCAATCDIDDYLHGIDGQLEISNEIYELL
jgi:hypothetical protein